jgi:hypothetical protein
MRIYEAELVRNEIVMLGLTRYDRREPSGSASGWP